MYRALAQKWQALGIDSKCEYRLTVALRTDVLGTLVRLGETDRPFGIQAEVLRMITRLVSALDGQFLVHSAVHKAVIRLLRMAVGDEIDGHVDGARPMGAASMSVRAEPSDYEYERQYIFHHHLIFLAKCLAQWLIYCALFATGYGPIEISC